MKPEQSEQFFIEELFNQSISSHSVESCELNSIDKLTGDASTRRYYRVFTNKDTFVVCLDNPTTIINSNTFIVKQKFFEQFGLRVPKIYDYNEHKGYILEEDLGDNTLLSQLAFVKDKNQEYQYYKKLIGNLVTLHSLESKKVKQSGLFELKFDYSKLISEIDMTLDFFVKDFLGVIDNNFVTQLRSYFTPICKRLEGRNMVLTHRDFHSRNVMVKDNELVIIDFQDARMGIPQYDLASLLDDCYYQLNEENKVNLLNYYYQSLDKDIHEQSFDEFLSLYNDMVIQRAFKAIGSFSYIFKERNDVRYLKYIGFAMEKIRKILLADEKYGPLKSNLFKVYYEN